MHARVISETDARKGRFGHRCAQPERQFSRIHATDFWATDTNKVWGKSQIHATYIPDARNPFDPARCVVRNAVAAILRVDLKESESRPLSPRALFALPPSFFNL